MGNLVAMSNYTITFVPYQTQDPNQQLSTMGIFFQPYQIVPPWASQVTDEIAFNITANIGVFNQVDLIALSNWHKSNSSNLYVNNITNRYFYTFDGGTNNINDGGNDMYDSGNFISLSTTSGIINVVNAQNINYGTIINVSRDNFGYYVSQSNVWPQISIMYIKSGTAQWRISGGIGTDNQAASSNSNVSGTYTTPTNGRYGSFWVNQIYNTTDPSIVTTWFTILQSDVNSVITSCNDNRYNANPPIDPMNQNFTVTGSNFLFGCFLLSSRNVPISKGEFIPTAQIQNFISNYVTNAVINIS